MKRLNVFGSAARDTDFNPETGDADVLAALTPPLLSGLFERRTSLLDDLRVAPGHDVDLTRTGAMCSPQRKEAINRDREPVYEA